MAPKEYTNRDLEVAERLSAVETRLESVQVSMSDHRKESGDRLEELHDLILELGDKFEASKFNWSSLISRENIKICVYLLASITGTSALVRAIWP